MKRKMRITPHPTMKGWHYLETLSSEGNYVKINCLPTKIAKAELKRMTKVKSS